MFGLAFHGRRGAGATSAGAITIGDFSERFESRLDVWGREHYRASWLRAAQAVLRDGYGCFLTSVGPPHSIYFSWPCWRRGEEALLINCLILSADTASFSAPEDAERWPQGFPDDAAVSRWRCPTDGIAAFAARLQAGSA